MAAHYTNRAALRSETPARSRRAGSIGIPLGDVREEEDAILGELRPGHRHLLAMSPSFVFANAIAAGSASLSWISTRRRIPGLHAPSS